MAIFFPLLSGVGRGCGGRWYRNTHRTRNDGFAMPGHHISDQQVFLFMTHRRQHTQAVAAAKAGISERSARRIENDPQLPSQKKKERHWRTRADPLEPFWPRVEELLQIDGIIAVTVFETLQDEFGEDAVPDAIRRTLERRIARWRALHGGEKEIFFPQHHEPGRQGLSDFTVCDSLKVTVAGETLSVDWRERGGPAVTEPEQAGFGSSLIKGEIEYRLRGTVKTLFAPDGLEVHLEFPFGKITGPDGKAK